MKPYKTLGAIAKELRQIVAHKGTVIRYRTFKNIEASSTWNDQNRTGITIYIGRGKSGIVRGTIHELLHVVLSPRMNGLGYSVEEPMILALEDKIIARIYKSDRQAKWWLETVRKKIQKEG